MVQLFYNTSVHIKHYNVLDKILFKFRVGWYTNNLQLLFRFVEVQIQIENFWIHFLIISSCNIATLFWTFFIIWFHIALLYDFPDTKLNYEAAKKFGKFFLNLIERFFMIQHQKSYKLGFVSSIAEDRENKIILWKRSILEVILNNSCLKCAMLMML